MISFFLADIDGMERHFRRNVINGIGGCKSANLIGSIDSQGRENLGLFSSIFHLGASPALLGFQMRPVHEGRHTYHNILDTGHFTVNGVSMAMHKRAHLCSAPYAREMSEFELCGFRPIYRKDMMAPFVAESPIQIGCKLEEDLEIALNGCRIIIGRILQVHLEESILLDDGCVDLHRADIAAIAGLNAYHPIGAAESQPYPAKPLSKNQP